jgi:hypothetical protein
VGSDHLAVAAAELWGTQSYSPCELEFLWTVNKVTEAAAMALGKVTPRTGQGAVPLPHQASQVKALNQSSNDDWLSSYGGVDEERAFHNYWLARGGQAFFDRFTAPGARSKDSYVELRRMVTRRAYLARLSQEWTMHGLDNREAFFWGGALVGQYLPMTWKAKEDQ